MHINKTLLFAKLQGFIEQKYLASDKELLLELCQKIIFYEPTQHCIIKSKRSAWQGLPPDKSLFYSAPQCGLPIGNLTSQVFANFYMNSFDHFIKHDLGIRYYGRYVDDFILVHEDKDYLKALIPVIKARLQDHLQLTLHPNKIYLQHYSKGVQFLGAIIKPHRIYIAKRTQGNFYEAVVKQNAQVLAQKPGKAQQAAFLSFISMVDLLAVPLARPPDLGVPFRKHPLSSRIVLLMLLPPKQYCLIETGHKSCVISASETELARRISNQC